MSDGVDPLVQAVQAAGLHTPPDPISADPRVAQLPRRHRAVLTSGNGRDALTGCVPFCVYMT